jgi:hypothetical protein
LEKLGGRKGRHQVGLNGMHWLLKRWWFWAGTAFMLVAIRGGALSPANDDREGTVAQAVHPAAVSDKTGKAIRFEPYRNLIFLPVRVNGSKAYWFVLDSGASSCTLDRTRAAQLGLKLEEGGKAVGLGSGTIDYDVTRNVTFSLPTIELFLANVTVMDLSSIRLLFGRPVDGILGYEFFARYVVALDHEAHTVEFIDPASYRYAGRGKKLPIEIERRIPFLTGNLKVAGRPRVERKFVVDTGSSGMVFDDIIEETSARKLRVLGGVGLGKEMPALAARVQNLQLGSFTIDNAVGMTGKPHIGGEILRRFHIVFDYSRQCLYLEPNRHFSEPYLFDASGLVLRMTKDGKHFRIHAVLDNSPATEAGLRAEDVITAIDNRSAADYKLPEVQQLFKQKGNEHELAIERGEAMRTVRIKLREIL